MESVGCDTEELIRMIGEQAVHIRLLQKELAECCLLDEGEVLSKCRRAERHECCIAPTAKPDAEYVNFHGIEMGNDTDSGYLPSNMIGWRRGS